MKRFTALLLAVLLAFTIAGCQTEAPSELALITDIGTIDDGSFNQGSWEGLVQYAEEHNMVPRYYQPTEQSDHAYLNTVDLAVSNGAKLIVTPGFLFQASIYQAQTLYPDVKFVLLDGVPQNPDTRNQFVAENTVAVLYAEEQAGFLAGYAAVIDGYRSLGFIGGMAVPAVVRFGYGFVQGAEYAAAKLGLDDVTINYHYTGNFIPTPETQTLAASWYMSGVEVIFACGGGLGNSVMAAAEAAGAKVIGVDRDQSPESETVITSAMKGLSASVYICVDAFYNDNFPGGQIKVFAADNLGVGLPMNTSRFVNFTQADYDAIFAQLANFEIDIVGDVNAAGERLAISDIPLAFVSVTETN
ncbi:MAG: BMP family ABC transporter substrate-binding protein [Defluviitaleaceae bacterium]|nr:BMP family ABC transporter substrate-binding protein [Defluviitaleaceae bacterium]MCL2835710.1 BMP family ABC transporter substrate-binding protein [Defluviitaleaceae bacterium]